jgi:hypothetical protein
MLETPGDRLLKEFRDIDPNLVTVLVSGRELEDDDDRLAHFDLRMRKPIEGLDMLRNTIERTLQIQDKKLLDGDETAA